MNFEEAGAALRAEREKRNISVEEVANQLKIGRRQIRALESGDIDSLPHPAYAKGFIRSYAAWLGLRPEDLRMQKPAGTGENERESLEMPETKKASGHAGCWVVLVLLCLCGGFYYAWQENFWGLLDRKEADKPSITTELPKANEFLEKGDSGNKEQSPLEKPAEPARNEPLEKPAEPAAPVRNEPAVAPVELPPSTPAQKPEEKAPAASPIANGAPAVEEKVSEAPAVPENHKLIITAIEECWVHSNSDKTDTRQFSLRKGDTFALTFTETLELKLGNAGGVRLRYDGRDLPPAGTSGQVKTLVFPPREDNE